MSKTELWVCIEEGWDHDNASLHRAVNNAMIQAAAHTYHSGTTVEPKMGVVYGPSSRDVGEMFHELLIMRGCDAATANLGPQESIGVLDLPSVDTTVRLSFLMMESRDHEDYVLMVLGASDWVDHTVSERFPSFRHDRPLRATDVAVFVDGQFSYVSSPDENDRLMEEATNGVEQ